jgi:hypothetical protein
MTIETTDSRMTYKSLGVTTDFDWYELTNVKNQLSSSLYHVERLIDVVRMREQSQHDYIIHLQRKNSELQTKLNTLLEGSK